LGRSVVIKVFKGSQDMNKAKYRLEREVCVWSNLVHRNIVPFLGISYDFGRPEVPSLVYPYFPNGNIIDFLKNRFNVNKLELIAQIAEALSYLHRLGIVHGDIKGSNILIDDSGQAMLCDFALSRSLGRSGLGTPLGTCKTLELSHAEDINPVTIRGWRWMACELMLDDDAECIQRATTQTDVWAFAMTAIEIITESIPFSYIKNDASVILILTSGGRPKREHYQQIHDDVWAMLQRCWDDRPSLRPSMAVLAQFFASRVAVERSRL